MTEYNEIMDDEELKRFFLTEIELLVPAVRYETSESTKLRLLHAMLGRMTRLLHVLSRCKLTTHYWDVSHVFGFYLIEKEGESRKKHIMSVRLHEYGTFLYHLRELSEVNLSYYNYYVNRLKSLEKILEKYYPDEGQNNILE